MIDLKTITYLGETILPVIFYGGNRSPEFLEWNKKVIQHLDIPMNYVECGFPGISHGFAMDYFTMRTHDKADYWLFMETDSIPLRKDFYQDLYWKVQNKRGIVSGAQQSNHKNSPNGDKNHPYAGPHCLMMPTSLHSKLGTPSFDHNNSRSDTAEEITYKCEELGYSVSLIWPSEVIGFSEAECKTHGIPIEHKKWKCGSFFCGPKTTYSDIYYHAYSQNVPSCLEHFIEKCKLILNE